MLQNCSARDCGRELIDHLLWEKTFIGETKRSIGPLSVQRDREEKVIESVGYIAW